MARRSLSDQRHLLVELELDETVVADPHYYAGVANVSAARRRPHDTRLATLQRTGLDHQRTPSPYKLKQKALSTRASGDHRPVATPSQLSSARPAMPSPLLLIADAIRENVAQRSRVLLDVQDELRRLPPPQRPTRRGAEPLLLSSTAIKVLNRLRSLTLSIVEMVRYFYEQLPASGASGDPAVWGYQYEFQQTLAQLSSSDVDGLATFPAFACFYETLGVSAIRNPFLDGVALDSSELLLCSCQALRAIDSLTSSSLFQLVVARLKAFAVHVHRQYPSWQTLPHDRVALALLDLLESENKANATRMLPSYLRPDARRCAPMSYEDLSVSTTDSEEEENEKMGVKPQAWSDQTQVVESSQRIHLKKVSRSPSRQVDKEQPGSVPAITLPLATVTPVVAKSKTLPLLIAETAEPKADRPLAKAAKSKKLHERHVSIGSLEVSYKSLSPRAEIKEKSSFQDPCLERKEIDEKGEDHENSYATIASALEKLPQLSLEGLRIASQKTEPSLVDEHSVEMANPSVEEAVNTQDSLWPNDRFLRPKENEDEHPTIASALNKLPQFSLDGFGIPSPSTLPTPPTVEKKVATHHDLLEVASPRPKQAVLAEAPPFKTPTLSLVEERDAEETASANASELSRILTLCRDVHVAAIDLNERLHPPAYKPLSPVAYQVTESPRTPTLSSRFLERELKMLRRYYRRWGVALAARHARLRRVRTAWAARRIGRFGRCILMRKRERLQRLAEKRQHLATQIQRSWRLYAERQSVRRRQRDCHLVYRCFKRYCFFTGISKRQRQREALAIAIQRWWRREWKHRQAIERKRQREETERARRTAAVRQLQAFTREQTLRRKLAEALETNRRIHMRDNFKTVKTRQDEEKRRHLEAKRLAEVRTAMHLALGEMETKWRQAAAETERLSEQKKRKETQVKHEAEKARRQLARERLDRFMERSILRRRLHQSVQASEDIATAKRALEFVRDRLERRHREDHAKRLLVGRILWWKVEKTVQHERLQAHDALWRLQYKRLRESDELRQQLHAQIRSRVAETRVLHYCELATHTLVETTYRSRLVAKHDEAQRLRRQAAREHIAGFVQHYWKVQRLVKSEREAEALRLTQQTILSQQQGEREQQHIQRVRHQSERIVQAWLLQQVVLMRERVVCEAVRRQAQEATRVETLRRMEAEREATRLQQETQQLQLQHRRHEQFVQLQRRKAQLRAQQLSEKHTKTKAAQAAAAAQVTQQHKRLEDEMQRHQQERAKREKLLELERRTLVDVMLDTQRLAHIVATSAVASARVGVHKTCERLELAMQYRSILSRAWLREVGVRWRQFVKRRQTLATLSLVTLWPDQHQHQHQQHTSIRDARLGELQRMTSARKVQRCWRMTNKRLRQWRRLQVKQAEDEMVLRAKGVVVAVSLQGQDDAVGTLSRWWRRRRLQFRVSSPVVLFFFSGGRAWAKTLESPTIRLRFNRAVTRKLLQAMDPSLHTRKDLDCLLQELAFDLQSLVASLGETVGFKAACSLDLNDVDALELPRFSLSTRQLSKTRSMVKRQQLLDAKTSPSPSDRSTGLSIFDAVETAALDDAQFLFLHGANLHAREPCHQRTALHMLAFSSDAPLTSRVAMLLFLVEKAKLDLHARDDMGSTPLMTYAAHGCLPLVEAVLAGSTDLELWRDVNPDGRNAFHCACAQDHPEIAVWLQRFVLSHHSQEETTLLRNLYAQDAQDITPVHTLAVRGHVECLHAVMAPLAATARVALLNARDKGGCTPLHLAIAHGHVDLTKDLLGLGANVSLGDSWQRRPLHYATGVANAIALITLLVESGADMNITDARGDTALHWAASSGRGLVVRHLLVLGADPTVLNDDWQRPLHVAAGYDCVRLLQASASSASLSHSDHVVNQELLVSAQSYCLPTAIATVDPRMKVSREIDWEEIHQDMELVEESGQFSSEDERDDDDDVGINSF